jgi:hypothetical protein
VMCYVESAESRGTEEHYGVPNTLAPEPRERLSVLGHDAN